jgi:hypothetical protein
VTIDHRTTRHVVQPPDIVHARLLELATEFRDDIPRVPPGDRFGQLLGIQGDIGLKVSDGGPTMIDVQTLRGRFRLQGTAELETAFEGGTRLTLTIAIQPSGLIARAILGIAARAIPGFAGDFHNAADRIANELAARLSKSEEEWDVKSFLGGA